MMYASLALVMAQVITTLLISCFVLLNFCKQHDNQNIQLISKPPFFRMRFSQN